MVRTWSRTGVAAWIVLLVLSLACGGGAEKEADEARAEEWTAIEADHQALSEARAELAELRVELIEAEAALDAEAEEAAEEASEEGELAEPMEGEEPAEEPMTPEAMAARIAELESEITTRSEDFGTRLVDYINADPLYQGETPSESQMAAFRLKSSEDIILAQEYVEKGGDYRRAIEIYEAALMVDPDNPELHAALEKAKADRFMTEERFAMVSEGMSQDQVRAVLGQVYHHNIREYPEKEVEAWFYPKEEGGAAGVYFQIHKKSEQFAVYRTDFEAVKAPSEEGGEPEEAAP